eukprot:gnl/TRDRNA2_/TRDRNA2_35549_c0_seq1.p1 gnl/TRDRNA2_/TRDRNA2_35549_c0~~gnl/TRDRNA2_/TRDRNA2_35549_c0_seq1.p1  ORF type:complete len:205 (+),score=46.07 gnl/TRDRNA2_/TRDRNA2_35549_c0_seq1:99-713(+)
MWGAKGGKGADGKGAKGGGKGGMWMTDRNVMKQTMAEWNPKFGWSLPDGTYWIGKKIGELNKSGELQHPIKYDEVIEMLSSIPEGNAVALLKELKDKAAEVRDPTQWIKSAAMKQLNSWYTGGRKPYNSGSTLSKAIGELNKAGVLVESIQYNAVVGPLSCMDEVDALALIQELQTNAATIKSPTNWLKGAATRSARKKMRPSE